VPRAKKKASEMTDKELVRALFPKPVRKRLKEIVLELNREKPKERKRRKP
jgi:hypothetical protein